MVGPICFSLAGARFTLRVNGATVIQYLPVCVTGGGGGGGELFKTTTASGGGKESDMVFGCS